MPSGETLEKLIDRKIDEAISKHDILDKDVKKRKPKPFRYLTDKEEIRAELEKGQTVSVSVMKEQGTPKIIEDEFATLGLGDMQTIENVIRRHAISRKFRDR